MLAIEASPINALLLKESVKKNHFHQLHVLNVAASDQDEVVMLSVSGPWTRVLNNQTSATQVNHAFVKAVRLSQLLEIMDWQDIGFIKVDVEGFEPKVLKDLAFLLGSSNAPLSFMNLMHIVQA